MKKIKGASLKLTEEGPENNRLAQYRHKENEIIKKTELLFR